MTCVLTHLDTNSDGFISAEEIDEYQYDPPCGMPSYVTGVAGADVIAECDLVDEETELSDGLLGSLELNTTTTGCLANARVRQAVCDECTRCENQPG